MPTDSRRQFVQQLSTVLAFSLAACQKPSSSSPTASELPPGAPPAFGTAPDVGPPVTAGTFAEAEKLVQFTLTPAEREMAAGNWRKSMAPLYERRAGPKKLALDPSVAPATVWNPTLPNRPNQAPTRDRFVRTNVEAKL